MKVLLALASLGLFISSAGADNSTYTAALQKYVHDGRVQYRGICKDPGFSAYIQQLSQIDPAKFTDTKAQLAFWINAYNAFTLKIICDHYPLKSINDLHTGGLILGTLIHETVWDKKFVLIKGEEMSLNHIEHAIIRKKFHDPRAHFALVCASISCPPLRPEAYEAEKLDQQLDEQGKMFFSERGKNYFETNRRIAHLSKILDWYSNDFGASNKDLLLFITRFLPAETAAEIKAYPDKWQVEYTTYDWGLNE